MEWGAFGPVIVAPAKTDGEQHRGESRATVRHMVCASKEGDRRDLPVVKETDGAARPVSEDDDRGRHRGEDKWS